ncbi:MAG TPA: ABC transporter permease [Bryobacteraceae bacterium]|jgi:predicted permease|nr:ABC transporter permease [Bryobacteraceae bacterium]
MDRFVPDLRLAFRRLRQNPTFSAVAVLTLALGIGANTAIFSIINAALLRPLPVSHASEIVSLNEKMGGDVVPTLSYPDFRDMRDRNTVLSGLMAYRFLPASLGLPGNNQRLWGYLVTGNYFDLLGVGAVRGRVLHQDDDLRPGGHPVAVLAWPCWQKHFGGDPTVVGRIVKINGMDFTILGITPQGFFGTELFFKPDVFFPSMMQKQLEGGRGYLEDRDAGNFFVAGRLKPGVSMARAVAGLNSVARGLAQQYPKTDAGLKIGLTPPGLAGNYIRGAVIGFAAALFGVSCLVLLVACTNLASILMARAADRRKEIALRLAVGAGRGSLVRQLLTENLVIAILGGAGGALLAVWITDALAAWRPPADFPLVINAVPDGRVFLFALMVSVLTTLLFGLLPALQAARTNLAGALKNEAISERLRHWQLRDYMVATQVALSAVLLVCSVLVVRSLQRALDAPIGYNPRGVVTASFDLNIQGYSEARGREYQRRLLDKVRAIPGIESAATIDWLPLSLNFTSDAVYIEGDPIPKPTDAPSAYSTAVSTDYFRTMQSRLRTGREFDSRDKQDGTRVAVVNKAFADQLIHGKDPIGTRFRTSPEGQPIQIVGVAEDGKYFSLTEPRKAAWWGPSEIWYTPTAALVARTNLNAPEALRLIQDASRDLDPSLPLYSAGTLVQRMDLPLFPARMAASALGAFGVLALILAATGIYGVMAYAISRRTREIGIRMAIGATQGQVLAIVARRALLLIGSGTFVGLAVALVAGRFLEKILYGIRPTDPLTLAIVLAMMLAIAALACWIPARRAIQINPVTALRQE